MTTRYPVFVWAAHDSATAYRLVVMRRGANNPRLDLRLDAAQICADGLCAVDAGLIAPPRPLGEGAAFVWWVAAITPDGRIPSARTPFRVAAPENTPTITASPTIQQLERLDVIVAETATAQFAAVQNDPPDDPNTIVGNTFYIYIQPGSFAEIESAIDRANADTANTYVILIPPAPSGSYRTSFPPAGQSSSYFNVKGNVILRGVNASFSAAGQIIIESSLTNVRLFETRVNSTLRMYNILIRNSTGSSHGGAIYNRGVLRLFQTTVENNAASNRGGAIHNTETGLVRMSRAIFRENVAPRGGALSNNGGSVAVPGNLTGTDCIIFRANGITSTVSGGAVYSETGFARVNRGIYRENQAASFRDIHYATPGAGVIVEARNSWWQTTPSVSGNVETDGARIGGTVPTLNCSVPDPPPLYNWGSFGLTLISDGLAWNTVEQVNILRAVGNTTNALSKFNTLGNTYPDKFKTVMGPNITLLRLAQTRPTNTLYGYYYDRMQSGYCQVFDPSTTINSNVIACRGPIAPSDYWATADLVTEYALVHELGHVLDIRSGLQLRGYVEDTAVYDCNAERVMGAASGQSWARGQRGWGTSGPNASNGQILSQFQQNPANTEVEAAADMFLNWVYRRMSDTAPTGISSSFNPVTDGFPAPTNACNYPLNGLWEGFRNIERTGATDNTKPGNVRYWWMEGTLGVIFENRGWK